MHSLPFFCTLPRPPPSSPRPPPSESFFAQPSTFARSPATPRISGNWNALVEIEGYLTNMLAHAIIGATQHAMCLWKMIGCSPLSPRPPHCWVIRLGRHCSLNFGGLEEYTMDKDIEVLALQHLLEWGRLWIRTLVMVKVKYLNQN